MAAITREELKQKIDRGDDFKLIETLPEDTFREAHLPGAENIPPNQIGDRAPEILPDKEEEIVVYCASPSCNASETAAGELIALGYKNIRDYPGGKQDWIDHGLPTEGDAVPRDRTP